MAEHNWKPVGTGPSYVLSGGQPPGVHKGQTELVTAISKPIAVQLGLISLCRLRLGLLVVVSDWKKPQEIVVDSLKPAI